MPADRCVELVDEKLAEFGLSLERDIVSICTDGASVMKKVGKLVAAQQQLCYAHGVQLAVLDVLYSRRTTTATAPVDVEHEAPHTDDVDDDALDADSDEQGLSIIQEPYEYNVIAELSGEYKEVVDKVRAIVRIFRRSPTKNDAILQPYVKRELGKELSLVLDCRTRWNSLYDMLARFIQLRNPVQKAMIDLKEPVQVTEADFTCVQDIVSSLEPVKLAVKALCRRDTNLITQKRHCIFALLSYRNKARNWQRRWHTPLKIVCASDVCYMQVFFSIYTVPLPVLGQLQQPLNCSQSLLMQLLRSSCMKCTLVYNAATLRQVQVLQPVRQHLALMETALTSVINMAGRPKCCRKRCEF